MTEMEKISLKEMLVRTGKRKEAFDLMIAHLRRCRYPLIVETGICRQENNFDGDGMSTLIWDAVCNEIEGTLQCVDIDPTVCRFAKDRTSDRTMIYCGDSVKFLESKEREYEKLTRKIDLLYLDSYDLDYDDCHASAQHHIYELLSIKGALRPGSLVAVDDNMVINDVHVGNGMYIAEWMDRIGKPVIYKGCQWIWEW